jgi:hypothetical protein
LRAIFACLPDLGVLGWSLVLRLLYSTTSALQVELTERYSGSVFKLHFADDFNASSNPPTSNPFRIFKEFQEVFETNDRLNQKLVTHFASLKRGTRRRLKGKPELPAALETIKTMGMYGIRPVLAILEAETYEAHGKPIVRLSPKECGHPTSVEYRLADIQGPGNDNQELHLHHLY